MWLAAVLTLLASVLFSVPDTILSMVSQSDSFLATVQKQFGAASPTYLLIAQRFGNFVDFVQAHSVLWQRLDFIGSYLTLALHLLMCLFANRLYFHHVRRKVAFLRNDTTSLIDVRSRIRMAGGGSYGFVALFIGAQILVTGLLYMAWLMCF
jgi:hypothetical protein